MARKKIWLSGEYCLIKVKVEKNTTKLYKQYLLENGLTIQNDVETHIRKIAKKQV